MTANKNLLDALKEKSPERAIEAARDFIKVHDRQRVIRDSKVLRLDDFYSGRYTLSKLISGEDNPNGGLYVYDEEKWCRGCQDNCNRVFHNIQLTRISDEHAREIVRESLTNDYPLMHALSRNLLLGLAGGFSSLLDTYRGRENREPIKESAYLKDSDYYCYSLEVPYTKAMDLIQMLREIPKV